VLGLYLSIYVRKYARHITEARIGWEDLILPSKMYLPPHHPEQDTENNLKKSENPPAGEGPWSTTPPRP
jgi:hypothetical protein